MINTNRLKGEIVASFGTQEAFSRAIGWHRNKVSFLCTGKYIPNTDEAYDIATLLNLNMDTYCEIFLPLKSQIGDN